MNTAKRDPLKGVPGHKPPPPLVTLTVWRPGAPLQPAAPMPGDRYGDDDRLNFRPVTP